MTLNKRHSSNLKEGELFDSDRRFQIGKLLGQGGQGKVYCVKDTVENNSNKALKILSKEILPQNLQRMRIEVNALKSINSKHVLRIESTNLDSYEQDSNQVPYFVTQLAKHGTLTKHNYYNGEINLSLRLFRDICEGVKAIHQESIIHRDLKPSNIFRTYVVREKAQVAGSKLKYELQQT